MSIEEAIIEKVRALPPERQREALAFVERLEHGGGEGNTAAAREPRPIPPRL